MRANLKQLMPIWAPHPGQREFLENGSKIKVLACGRRWGKTDACAISIVLALLEDSPTKHLILAPTLDQASGLFDRVVSFLDQARDAGVPGFEIIPKIRKTPHPRLTFGTHVVTARSGHVGRLLRGQEATHIVIDEAAFVPEELITEVAMPMLATTNGILTLISTPRGLNHFWNFYRMGESGEHGIWSRSAPSEESPLVSQDYLSIQKALISQRAFEVEYLAKFHETEGRVFHTAAIERCLVPILTPPEDAPIYVGIDWARYADSTVVAVVKGDRHQASLIELVSLAGLSWSEQLSRVRQILSRYPTPLVCCDATGGGDPLVEALRLGAPSLSIEGFVFHAASKQMLIENLSWMMEEGAIAMTPHPELLRELHHFEATTSPAGNTILAAKSGFHDDHVTALALACHRLPRPYATTILMGDRRTFSRSHNQGEKFK